LNLPTDVNNCILHVFLMYQYT